MNPESASPENAADAPTLFDAQLQTAARPTAAPEISDYELLRRIGHGSYGEVWLARNVLGEFRAVKIVYRDRFESDRPFQREFEGIQQFEPISRSHESQVDVLHVGRRDSYFYYVMELADDASNRNSKLLPDDREPRSSVLKQRVLNAEAYVPKTLRSEIQKRGALPFDECLEIALKLTEALAHLHRHGLVHRDVKPSNIIFVNGIPKLADIGLVARSDDTLSFVGTEGYIAPEGPGKVQSDLFSLGKVLYEACTGRDRLAFPELPTDLAHDNDRAREFVEFNEVILKACETDPKKRYQSAAEMHADLVLLQAGKSLKRTRMLERRLAFVAKAVAVMAALAIVVLAAFLYQQRQTERARRLAAELQLTRGVSLMDEGDLSGALLWFTEALAQARWSRSEEQIHRLRIGTLLQQHPRLVQLIAPEKGGRRATFSPDGKRLLTFRQTHVPQLWDVESGRLLASFPQAHSVRDAEFSPDGTRIATACASAEFPSPNESEARIWDAATGTTVVPPLRHAGWVLDVEFSPDGRRLLTASSDRTAQLWDAYTGDKLGSPMVHQDSVNQASFSPDGRFIITASKDRTAQVWDANSGTKIGPALAHKLPVGTARFSPDGRRVCTTDPTSEKLWDVEKDFELVSEEKRAVVIFAPTGEWFTTGSQVWNAQTGERLAAIPQSSVASACAAPDGRRFALGNYDGSATVWDAFTGKPASVRLHHNGTVTGVAFAPKEDQLAVASDGGKLVRVWELNSSGATPPPLQHGHGISLALFSRDGKRLLTAGQGGAARVWDAVSAAPISPPLTNQSYYSEAALSLDGQQVVSSIDPNTAAVWNAETGARIGNPMSHESELHAAVFSPDAKRLATVTYAGTVQVWDVATGTKIGPSFPKWKRANCAAFSPDGKRLALGGYPPPEENHTGAAIILDLDTGTPLTEMMMHSPGKSPVYSVEFSRDGSRLLTLAPGDGARVWDSQTGKPITPILNHNGGNMSLGRFSPDGNRVLTTGDDQTARLWNANSGQQLIPPMRHAGSVLSIAFSTDGRLLATASVDHTARVWDAATGLPITPPLRHPQAVTCVAFDPNGNRIVTTCRDGAARFWNLASFHGGIHELRQRAHLLSGRRLDHPIGFVASEPHQLQQLFADLHAERR